MTQRAGTAEERELSLKALGIFFGVLLVFGLVVVGIFIEEGVLFNGGCGPGMTQSRCD